MMTTDLNVPGASVTEEAGCWIKMWSLINTKNVRSHVNN